jgi:hypothetical protein
MLEVTDDDNLQLHLDRPSAHGTVVMVRDLRVPADGLPVHWQLRDRPGPLPQTRLSAGLSATGTCQCDIGTRSRRARPGAGLGPGV